MFQLLQIEIIRSTPEISAEAILNVLNSKKDHLLSDDPNEQ